MARTARIAILSMFLAGIAAMSGANAAGEEKPLVETWKLANGLTVVVRENRSSPVVAVQVWVKAGSTTEPADRAGMSHLLEHMAFKGTKRRGPGQIAREVESLGGEINAYTSFDQTVYHITISNRYLGEALDILADTLGNSVFDAGELAREKEVVLEELRMNEDDPDRVASKALFREAFRVHPYGRPVIGYADTIRSIGRDDLVAYFEKYYQPGNMVLVIAGDADAQAARPLVEKTFLQLPAREVPRPQLPAEPPQDGARAVVQERDAKRAYLDIGFPGPSIRDGDMFAWDLLSSILGGGQTSRLYHAVKDERGLVDSVSAYAYTPKDPGLLMIGATGAAKKAAEALREILVQAFLLSLAPPEGKELARAKTQTESDFVYSLESQSSLARHVGFYETALGDAGFEREYLRRIRAVTADDIVAVARKYIRPETLNVSAVVPRGEAALLPPDAIRRLAQDAFREAQSRAAAAAPAPKQAVRKEVLPNGIRVIVRENRSVPVVAIQAGFLGGLRVEPPDKTGISVLAGEMLTKGTAARTAREIAEVVEDMAAELSGSAGRNSISLRGKFMRRDFGQGLRLFAESLLSPTFPADELEKKKKEVLGRLRLQKDELTQAVFLLFLARHYDGHPYARNPLGTEETVARITAEDVRAHYARWADPRNLVIAVSGDIGTDEAVDAIRKAFGGMAQRPDFRQAGPMPVPPEEGIRRVEEARDKEQSHFVIGFTGARFTDPDRYAFDVLGSALAGMGGRLFTNLRDRKSLAYSVTSFSSEQVDPGFFAFYMGTSSDKLDGAVAETLREIAEVRQDGISPEDFERAKKWMIGTYEIGLQSNAAYADRMMYNELYGVGYEETFEAPRRIESVRLEDVNRVARRVLSDERYTIAIIRGK